MASGIGRLGAIVASVLIGLIVSLKLLLEQNFFVIGAAGIVGALTLACINHRLSASGQRVDTAVISSPAPESAAPDARI